MISLSANIVYNMLPSILRFFFVYLTIAGVFGQRNVLNKNVDEVCKTEPDDWKCKSRANCPTLRKALENRIRPDICSFLGNDAIFCCPTEKYISSIAPATGSQPTVLVPVQKPSTGSADDEIKRKAKEPSAAPTPAELKAEKMCQVYSKYVYRTVLLQSMLPGEKPREVPMHDCSIEPLIVGGVDAKPKEFPHMALVGYEENNQKKINWVCGGSLISPKFVLTAAHCVITDNRFKYWVRLGEYDTSSEKDDSEPENIGVLRKIIHPRYSNQFVYNDIALFELESEAKLSTYVRPLCLFTGRDTGTDKAVASGWGHTRWEGRPSAKLQKVMLPLISNHACNKTYGADHGKELPKGIVKNLMLCAGGSELKDTCQGDSGGPLQIPHKNIFCMYSIIGVVSYGKGCALGYPSIYTRVSKYLPWIVSIVWP